MSALEEREEKFITAVAAATDYDAGASVSMWAVGEEIGLDHGRTEDMAMDLVGAGLLEIKTLSGGVGLTEEGLARVALQAPPEESAGLDLDRIAEQLTAAAERLDLPPERAADLAVDLETLSVHLRRSRPLTEVTDALIRSIRAVLAGRSEVDDALDQLERLIGAAG